ncbi:MAG: hypothetical protein Ct9H300mP1_34880 [Planctomycetaceae bacterium]|nr:MAG: hypothetical protein Ct9H300mP1_34880 [Planctomycetaceae bacterium]
MHLLTREALELYYRKLSDDGFLVIHISNPHVSLGPVWETWLPTRVRGAGFAATSSCRLASRNGPGTHALRGLSLGGKPIWGVLDSKSDLPWIEITPDEPEAAWTDDFSDVFNILR